MYDRIKDKYFLGGFLLLVIFCGLGSFQLKQSLDTWIQEFIEVELSKNAQLLKTNLSLLTHAGPLSNYDNWCDLNASNIDLRISIIDKSGQVLGDSLFSGDSLRALENHHDRPEIVSAAQHRSGFDSRQSSSIGKQMTYAATQIRSPYFNGFIRVARNQNDITTLIGTLSFYLTIAALLGFALAVGGFKLNKRTLSLNDSVQSIAEERNLLEAVLESMNEGVIMFNTSGHAARANQAALALLKLERTASPNQLQAAVIACGIIDLINQTQQNPVSKELEWGEQNTQYILAQAAPLKNEEGVVVVLHDVTHIRILERVRKDFVANVSHELRTPVSIIQANSETLLDGAKDDPAACAMFLEAIQRNSERMGAVISDLLDISRIEAGQMPMALKAVDLDDEVQHVIQSLSQKISSNQVQLKAVIPDKTLVRADQTSLNQILFNLINNAIQYTSNPAQIWIEATLIQAPEIQLKKTDPKDSETKQLNHNMVRIEVKDNGPGIAPEHQTRLFERFYRVDKGRTRNMGGTGLGLSIVKNLVETMQGEVGIKNNTPCGTIFWFELPEA